MTSALITGGAGFVGSHLAETLLKRDWRVEVIDDLATGSIENISHLKGHANFSCALDTVMNRPVMLELVDRADVVFHLAAAVGVRMVVERPVHTIETNIKATELVLELAARKRKPLLVTSTSEVYGQLDQPNRSSARMHRRLPDISKIQRAISYEPTLEFSQMLERIIASGRTHLPETTAAIAKSNR